MLKKLLLIFTLIVSLSACAKELPHQKRIVVSLHNPEFSITEQSNPTTGFSWKLISYDKNLITFLHHHTVTPHHSTLMGAPGHEIWTFKANHAHYRVNQVGHICLEYARPWTKQGARKINVIVVVKAR